MAGRKIMSLEAAMEEERAEIENIMLQQSQRKAAQKSPVPAQGPFRSPSPYAQSPSSPIRSMLDIGNRSAAPPRSMLDIGGDYSAPSPRSPGGPSSTHTSPTLSFKNPTFPAEPRHRSMSDAASNPADFGPRATALPSRGYNDNMSSYRFADILPTNIGQAQPGKRNAPAPPSGRSSSIGEALRSADLSNLVFPGERSRQLPSRTSNKSKSPSNRFNTRSDSPHGGLFGSNASRNQNNGTIVLADGRVIDMGTAYRKLSDANLLHGGSKLSSLARKKPTEADGNGRIEKDNLSPYGDLLSDEETDDDGGNSSDEESERGRKLTTRADSETEGSRSAKSLLAAMEDERKEISGQPKYRSLFDDSPAPGGSGTSRGAQGKTVKAAVQPETSFDDNVNGPQTPFDPDLDADVSAIRQAQKLELTSTPIIHTLDVHRAIRILYRGQYQNIQREADEEHRRLRKYLVATDLSDESTHALEWAIGTVLRDGDTLIAIYCVDEEASGSSEVNNVVSDDPKALREQAAAVGSVATKTGGKPQSRTASPHPSYLSRGANSPHLRAVDNRSATSSPVPSPRNKTKLEEERDRAVQDITDRVSKLLRKTQLEVRVIIEVIHCKNPKHLITEVIDLVSPTLVILGSRGRSALKGTLLGSFSNYLVTKSSVPVMVARKRLRKKSKYQPPPAKQVNNLSNPSARTLEHARID